MRFTKMHGLGNDYVYVNCFEERVENPSELACIISNRHTGIGADGLILIGPSQTADVRMRIFNADGSEAEMCGNGIRCVGKYAYEHKLCRAGGAISVPGQRSFAASLNVETGNGILTLGLAIDRNDKVERLCVNMGQPILTPKDVPVNLPGEEVIEQPIEVLGRKLLMTCVSMGNPHAVFFCDNVGLINLAELGPAVEHHSLFPRRTNVHFVQIDRPAEFTIRTWERGSGVCACCVAAVLTGRQGRLCTAHLPGGDLELNWRQDDNCVHTTGPATEVFEGTWPED